MQVTRYRIRILGRLWMPMCVAATEFNFKPGSGAFMEEADIEGEFWENVARHSDDFSSVDDYEVTADGLVPCSHGRHPRSEVVRPFKNGEESELAWSDCMYPGDSDS